ncbi:MAG: hypothetical protein MHM6MM_002652 [Cercozoa sp. M6MM]
MQRVSQRLLAQRRVASTVFDRTLKQRQKALAATAPDAHQFEYLRDSVCDELLERLLDIKEEDRQFPHVLDHGAWAGNFFRLLNTRPRGFAGIQHVTQLEECEEMLNRDAHLIGDRLPGGVTTERVVFDPEAPLPFNDESVDLVVSNLSLHWINALPEAFAEAFRVLRPGGALLGAMLGGNTLSELRSAFALADEERVGAMGNHTSPLTRGSDVASLLQRAKFRSPTVDARTLTAHFENLPHLARHLQGMGEQHAPALGAHASIDTMAAASAIYDAMYGQEQGEQTVIPATFDVIYFIAWKTRKEGQEDDQRGPPSEQKDSKDPLDLSRFGQARVHNVKPQ